jgi:hypothetical protein
MDCLVCGCVLPDVETDGVNQPSGGTEFSTRGHYGSAVTDHMDGTRYIVNVCDDCLLRSLESQRARRVQPASPDQKQ